MILMKNLILILIFAAVSLNTMASNPVHVIITAGQSNTDGRTPNEDLPAYIKALATDTLTYTEGAYRYCQIAQNDGKGEFIPFWPRATMRTRDGNFSLHGLMGFDMHGKTAGIIGTGKIAKILIQILRGFGMNVLAYDLYPDYNFAREHQVVYCTLDELYHSSDIISLHCPLTEQTKYLINDYSISKMKDGVMIINTGRGQLIHTNALIEGLKTKKVGYAGLDVYEEEEPYFYEDKSDKIIDDDTLARLLSFNNVIVTSHQAFFTKEAMTNIAHTTLQNVKDFVEGRPLVNEVAVGRV